MQVCFLLRKGLPEEGLEGETQGLLQGSWGCRPDCRIRITLSIYLGTEEYLVFWREPKAFGREETWSRYAFTGEFLESHLIDTLRCSPAVRKSRPEFEQSLSLKAGASFIFCWTLTDEKYAFIFISLIPELVSRLQFGFDLIKISWESCSAANLLQQVSLALR